MIGIVAVCVWGSEKVRASFVFGKRKCKRKLTKNFEKRNSTQSVADIPAKENWIRSAFNVDLLPFLFCLFCPPPPPVLIFSSFILFPSTKRIICPVCPAFVTTNSGEGNVRFLFILFFQTMTHIFSGCFDAEDSPLQTSKTWRFEWRGG